MPALVKGNLQQSLLQATIQSTETEETMWTRQFSFNLLKNSESGKESDWFFFFRLLRRICYEHNVNHKAFIPIMTLQTSASLGLEFKLVGVITQSALRSAILSQAAVLLKERWLQTAKHSSPECFYRSDFKPMKTALISFSESMPDYNGDTVR